MTRFSRFPISACTFADGFEVMTFSAPALWVGRTERMSPGTKDSDSCAGIVADHLYPGRGNTLSIV